MTARALLRAKWVEAMRQAAFVPRALRLALEAAGARAWLWMGCLILQALVPVGLVVLSRPVANTLAAAIGSGPGSPQAVHALGLAAAAAGLILASELLRSAGEWLRADVAHGLEDHATTLILRKSTEVDLAFYDSAEFHDRLHRAREEARYRPIALLETAAGLGQNAITLLGLAAVLATYGAWIAAALLASALPALAVIVRFAVMQHGMGQRLTADERRAWYLDWLMTASDAAAELRLLGLANRLLPSHGRIRARLRAERRALALRQFHAEALATVLALMAAVGCVAWMGWRALAGEVSLGDVALFYFAFGQGQRMMRAFLAGLGQAYRNVLFLGNLFEFLDLRAQVAQAPHPRELPPAPQRSALRFVDVTFRYPGSDRVALRNFDLSVPAGQVVAIVGANGAGKSTLLKLLCRFYDPQAGRIEMDGVDLRELRIDAIRERVAALFQQPVRFSDPVADNIAPWGGVDDGRIEAAATFAGADRIVARLPDGYGTLLGRWFTGGHDLSVGEWQRIALARAFARDAGIMLLDEPTSAMDSWAEAEWMRQFRTAIAGRTAIIVTHRFTTAMRADLIHVMHEGRIVESGSHAELTERGGRYAQSWAHQTRSHASEARQR